MVSHQHVGLPGWYNYTGMYISWNDWGIVLGKSECE